MREAHMQLPKGTGSNDWLENQLLILFGGYTATENRGCWISPKGEIMREDGCRYTVSMFPGSQEDRFFDLARRLCRHAKQQCIYLVDLNGKTYFVEPN